MMMVAIWPCRWPDSINLAIWKPYWLLKNSGWPQENIWLKFGLIGISLATMKNSWPQRKICLKLGFFSNISLFLIKLASLLSPLVKFMIKYILKDPMS